jgi:hypothetical protein
VLNIDHRHSAAGLEHARDLCDGLPSLRCLRDVVNRQIRDDDVEAVADEWQLPGIAFAHFNSICNALRSRILQCGLAAVPT